MNNAIEIIKQAENDLKPQFTEIECIRDFNQEKVLQAFIDNDATRLYDPGIRFPGDDFHDLYKVITGIDIPKMLIEFALTGKIAENWANKIKNATFNKQAAMILPCLKPGKIAEIKGYDQLKNNKKFVSFSKAYSVGETVSETHDVRQRFGEFCIVCDTINEMKETIDKLFRDLKVIDTDGNNMLIECFDTNKLKEY